MFGQGRSRGGGKRQQKGRDVQVQVELTFMEAAKGCKKNLNFTVSKECKTCSGDGAKPGSSTRKCAVCRGTGETMNGMGFFQVHSTCRACQGAGMVTENPCEDCSGNGRVDHEMMEEVQIPAGVATDVQLRLPGKGEPGGKGGQPGQLFVHIIVAQHPVFTREGYDVHVEIPISVSQAILGGKVTVPTLDRPQVVAISPGTQPGKVVALRNHGIAHLQSARSQFGDLMVHFTVVVPKTLTEQQKTLMEQFAREEAEPVGPKV